MKKNYVLIMYIAFLLIFALLFLVGVLGITDHTAYFGIGIGYVIENYMIMILSGLAIVKIFSSIVKH